MFKPLSYLKFYITASNAHGIHSPFIYDFVTKGLYSNSSYSHGKSMDILLRYISYFTPQTIELNGANETLKKVLLEEFPFLEFSTSSETIYFDLSSESLQHMFHLEDIDLNNKILFFDRIRQNKKTKKIWKSILETKDHFISVDLYYCGILFFKPTQAKQHFRIRI